MRTIIIIEDAKDVKFFVSNKSYIGFLDRYVRLHMRAESNICGIMNIVSSTVSISKNRFTEILKEEPVKMAYIYTY